jgi:hypothetical protein
MGPRQKGEKGVVLTWSLGGVFGGGDSRRQEQNAKSNHMDSISGTGSEGVKRKQKKNYRVA